jgi:uncharacterized protein with PIN domain
MLDLLCPNCRAKIGHADQKDKYKEVFYYKNEDGTIYCDNCKSGKDFWFDKIFKCLKSIINEKQNT